MENWKFLEKRIRPTKILLLVTISTITTKFSFTFKSINTFFFNLEVIDKTC